MDELKQQLIDYIEEHSDGFEDMPWNVVPEYAVQTIYAYILHFLITTKPNNQKKGCGQRDEKEEG
jgi:hypothetical protein